MSDPYRDDPIARARVEGHAAGLREAAKIVKDATGDVSMVALLRIKSVMELGIVQELMRVFEAMQEKFERRAQEVERKDGT